MFFRKVLLTKILLTQASPPEETFLVQVSLVQISLAQVFLIPAAQIQAPLFASLAPLLPVQHGHKKLGKHSEN